MNNFMDAANYSWNVHTMPLFVCSGLMIGVGVLSLIKKQGSLIARRFSYISLSVSVWLVGTAMGYLSKDGNLATVWFRLDNFGVAFISPCVYAFSMALLGYERKKSVTAGYWLALLI